MYYGAVAGTRACSAVRAATVERSTSAWFATQGSCCSLHHFAVEHHHGRIGDPEQRPYGNGVALWLEIDDFDAAVRHAEVLNAEIALAPHRNPPEGPARPAHREIWLRDPDGYLVVRASPDGESRWPDPRFA